MVRRFLIQLDLGMVCTKAKLGLFCMLVPNSQSSPNQHIQGNRVLQARDLGSQDLQVRDFYGRLRSSCSRPLGPRPLESRSLRPRPLWLAEIGPRPQMTLGSCGSSSPNDHNSQSSLSGALEWTPYLFVSSCCGAYATLSRSSLLCEHN